MNKKVLCFKGLVLSILILCLTLVSGCTGAEVRPGYMETVAPYEPLPVTVKSKIPTIGFSISCSTLFSEENDCFVNVLRIFTNKPSNSFSDSAIQYKKPE